MNRQSIDEWNSRYKGLRAVDILNEHKKPKKTRHRQQWVSVGGKRCYFRSLWEVNYARYLEWLKQNQLILDWQFEADTFWFHAIKRGVCSYLPDFKVIENDGSIVYHEVKGYMDSKSKTKLKRMAKYYPSVKIVVIDSYAYHLIKKKVYGIVDWEYSDE